MRGLRCRDAREQLRQRRRQPRELADQPIGSCLLSTCQRRNLGCHARTRWRRRSATCLPTDSATERSRPARLAGTSAERGARRARNVRPRWPTQGRCLLAAPWTGNRAGAARAPPSYLATMTTSAEIAARSATMSGAGGGGVPRAWTPLQAVSRSGSAAAEAASTARRLGAAMAEARRQPSAAMPRRERGPPGRRPSGGPASVNTAGSSITSAPRATPCRCRLTISCSPNPEAPNCTAASRIG